MKKKIIRLLTAVFLLACQMNGFSQEALKSKIVTKLQQNVFEVVVKKIENDPQNPDIIKTVRGIGYKIEL